jgi:hypothetical protein
MKIVSPGSFMVRRLALILRAVRSGRETVAEHCQTNDGFRFGRLVLKNAPVLGELAVFEAHDISGDPRRGTTVARETPVAIT